MLHTFRHLPPTSGTLQSTFLKSRFARHPKSLQPQDRLASLVAPLSPQFITFCRAQVTSLQITLSFVDTQAQPINPHSTASLGLGRGPFWEWKKTLKVYGLLQYWRKSLVSVELVKPAGPGRATDTPGRSPVKISHRARYDPVQLKRQTEMRAGIGVSNTKNGSFQFYGPSSYLNLVQRVYQRIHEISHGSDLDQKQKPIPDGLQKWGLENFIFSARQDEMGARTNKEAILDKSKCDAFLSAYFRLVHPLIPIISRSETISMWEAYWGPPGSRHDMVSKDIIFMILALGARVSRPTANESASDLEKWAEYFSSQSSDFSFVFQEPSFKILQFLLLKAMDSLQAMRPNETYLLLGHAARTALSLGINRSQVANGNSFSRPTSLLDDYIDVSYPEDLPEVENIYTLEDLVSGRPTKECAWVRSMAGIGRLAEKAAQSIYSSTSMKTVENLEKIDPVVQECDTTLDVIAQSLPSYLHFFDEKCVIGQEWQEIQRAHLGINHHMMRMVIHRPALVFTSFFETKIEAKESFSGFVKLEESVIACISAAKGIVTLCNEVMFKRFPDIRNDASFAAFLIAACVTLLYDVIGPGVDPEYAKDILSYVNRGIHCLDQMEHIGPTTGKKLSIDVMECVKEAIQSSSQELQHCSSLFEEFPWLDQESEIPEPDFTRLPQPAGSDINHSRGVAPCFSNPNILSNDIDLAYMSQWLNGDFANIDPWIL
ncbi:fungal specific transcription factor domain-containing protein [Aspergillus affinis]|uniref:fungal specific transcription factor domain-containing protein n=1 Tax=Aspergillus affinis TaxID=1070780 RepID=UPI0022FE9377|nr:uncharacterized protein KD926_000143 [Aspergillus affinis]KAI9037657.1 hypothetical protein KD926_000143 [Aspergillus affinis]